MSMCIRKVPVHLPRPRWAGRSHSRKHNGAELPGRPTAEPTYLPGAALRNGQTDHLRFWPPGSRTGLGLPTLVFLLRVQERGSWEGLGHQEGKVEPKGPLAWVTGWVWLYGRASGAPRPDHQLLFVRRPQTGFCPVLGAPETACSPGLTLPRPPQAAGAVRAWAPLHGRWPWVSHPQTHCPKVAH